MTTTASDEHWLRFVLVRGIGRSTQRRLLKELGSPEAVCGSSKSTLSRYLSKEQLSAWQEGAEEKLVQTTISWAKESNHHIVPLGHSFYPEQLLDIDDPPSLLYAVGNIDLVKHPAIAVVGSRNATPGGCDTARAFSASLSNAGLTILSGLALGIDAAAHWGGLDGTSSTIAVVGTGLDRVYPASNIALAKRIALEGLLLSEFPLGTPALASNFPRRNKVISGLSRGVLVVEAALKSGSLLTAQYAVEYGRDVFAVPGSIHHPLARGCHSLIRQGAKLVESTSDILEELPYFLKETATAQVLDFEYGDPVLDAIGFDCCDLDTICLRSGKSIEEVTPRLLDLELQGHITMISGGRVQRLRRGSF